MNVFTLQLKFKNIKHVTFKFESYYFKILMFIKVMNTIPRSLACKQSRYFKTNEEKDILGFGSYGFVTRCRDTRTNENLAVKQIQAERGISSSTLREIVLLGQLQFMNHPNVIKIRDVVTDTKKLTFSRELVMDCAETDLKKYLKNLKEFLSIEQIQNFTAQILHGVSYCHSMNIIHRDLKPQNVLIKDGLLKLADFGLARSVSPFHEVLSPEVVTLSYRSPELLLGETKYSFSVDIWSIGCILVEMLTKVPLFRGDSTIGLLHKIFQTLGTPTVEEWPVFATLEGIDQISSNTYLPIDFAVLFPTLTYDGIELLRSILRYNPSFRPTASTCLQSNFLYPQLLENKAVSKDVVAQIFVDNQRRRMSLSQQVCNVKISNNMSCDGLSHKNIEKLKKIYMHMNSFHDEFTIHCDKISTPSHTMSGSISESIEENKTVSLTEIPVAELIKPITNIHSATTNELISPLSKNIPFFSPISVSSGNKLSSFNSSFASIQSSHTRSACHQLQEKMMLHNPITKSSTSSNASAITTFMTHNTTSLVPGINAADVLCKVNESLIDYDDYDDEVAINFPSQSHLTQQSSKVLLLNQKPCSSSHLNQQINMTSTIKCMSTETTETDRETPIETTQTILETSNTHDVLEIKATTKNKLNLDTDDSFFAETDREIITTRSYISEDILLSPISTRLQQNNNIYNEILCNKKRSYEDVFIGIDNKKIKI